MRKHRDIYLRAHTAKHTDRPREHLRRSEASGPRWPDRILIFDTETRTDVHQVLMFGVYRICKLVNGLYQCESEGVVYSEEITKAELAEIGTFILNTFAETEVKQFPPQARLQVHRSFPEFMQKVFWPAVRKGWLVSGFHVSFDLSRLSRGWRRSHRGGFRLILSLQLDYKTRTHGNHIRTVPTLIVMRRMPAPHSSRSAPHAFAKMNGQIQDDS